MSGIIRLICPHCNCEICRSGDFCDSRALFDGRFYIRYCRPTLTTVYASYEGARCCACGNVIGGAVNFIGCYGYFFLSGPFSDFAAMHEFYGAVHLFPGDDVTARAFIETHGYGFPFVLETYAVEPVDVTHTHGRILTAYPDSYLNFLNRQALYAGTEDESGLVLDDTTFQSFLDSVLDGLGPIDPLPSTPDPGVSGSAVDAPPTNETSELE